MTEFGRVGHMVAGHGTDAVFMVIGESDDPVIRDKAPDYRLVLNLFGVGNQGGMLIHAGEVGAVRIERDSAQIEWFDD